MKFKIEDLAWQKHMRQSDLAKKTGLRWATIHKYWANIDIRRPDMVVLDKNPLKVDPMTLKDIIVLETIKEGKSIYKKN